jgi:hypothetical protein
MKISEKGQVRKGAKRSGAPAGLVFLNLESGGALRFAPFLTCANGIGCPLPDWNYWNWLSLSDWSLY